jgi:uncharacterized protein YciI
MKKLSLVLLLMVAFVGTTYSQQEQNNAGKKQFLYLVRLEKAMYDSTAWAPDKVKIVQDHFAYLQKLLADGILILAGRTEVEFDKTFGIVIFEANNFEEAKSIAENDPAVKGKVMNVEVYPYSVALIREGDKK